MGQISYLDALVKPIRKMMISNEMGNQEIFEHLESIDRYLQDEDSIVKLLFLLPTNRQGLAVIGEGLFSSNKTIATITVKILQKLMKSELGRESIHTNLNMFHQLKLSQLI